MISGLTQTNLTQALSSAQGPVAPKTPTLTPSGQVGSVTEPLPADFGQVLGQMAMDAMSTVQQSEQTAVAAIKGEATTQQVVESMLAAEQTLQASIAIRDKVIAAYQEVSRMQI